MLLVLVRFELKLVPLVEFNSLVLFVGLLFDWLLLVLLL